MGTEMVTALASRQRLWIAASLIVLVAGCVALFLFGPFLEARFALSLRGIAPEDYTRALHDACARGDTETLALLRDARADLNHRNGNGLTPLHTAVSAEAAGAVEMLLEGGADQQLVDAEGYPPLSLALLAGDTPIARLFLERRGSPLVPLGEDRQPAPFEAVATGNLPLLRLLLAYDLDADVTDPQGASLLAHAIWRADRKMIETLLRHGANASATIEPGVSYLAYAVRTGDVRLAELLVERGADVEILLSNGMRLIEYAVDTDKRDIVRLLLTHGADANGLVSRAVRRGRTEILTELLAGGATAKLMIDEQPAIEWAVRNASPELVGVLLDHGADPEILGREGQPLLALAVALDRPEVVATLADHGANIDARVVSPALDSFADLFETRLARKYLTKDRGLTPLMLAVLRGSRDTVRVLLDRNARLATPTAVLGTWPIGLAAYQDDVPMMQLLLGRDPDPAKQRRRILVSLADQTAALFVDGDLHLKTRVSTGREGYETQPGKYVITNKYRSWTSNLYDAPMPYFLRLNAGAVGLHEGFVPDHPASHGCIRVPRGTAEQLFASTRVGDPVTIVKGSIATGDTTYVSSVDQPTLD